MSPAALFVRERSVYEALGLDCWTQTRDARLYMGEGPVIAHPPCQRWGRYFSGGPSAPRRHRLGDDDGCFASALASVRRCGGVLEHPAHSAAWRVFDLAPPPRSGEWVQVAEGQWTVEVCQGWYGHRAIKRTWLWACCDEAPQPVNNSDPAGLWWRPVEKMGHAERERTPEPFARYLLSLVKNSCGGDRWRSR